MSAFQKMLSVEEKRYLLSVDVYYSVLWRSLDILFISVDLFMIVL